MGIHSILLASFLVGDLHGIKGSVCCIGDVDGDAHADVVVAARGRDKMRVCVLSGKDGVTLYCVTEGERGEKLGRSLAAIGDVDGDGVGDFCVGAYSDPMEQDAFGERFEEADYRGYVLVVSGSDGEVLWRLESGRMYDSFGFSVAGGADFDGDGVPDIVVGAPGRTCLRTEGDQYVGCDGAVYGFSGKTGKQIFEYADTVTGVTRISGVHGGKAEPGSVAAVEVERRSHSLLGTSIAVLPDMDADDRAEILVTSSWSDGGSRSQVTILSGRSGTVLLELSPDLGAQGSSFGWESCHVGDQNGDDVPDFAVSSHGSFVHLLSGVDGSALWSLGRDSGHIKGIGAAIGWGGEGSNLIFVTAADDWGCNNGYFRLYRLPEAEPVREFVPGLDPARAGCGFGVEAAAVGDFDGDAFPDFVLSLPLKAEVLGVSGKKMKVVWSRTLR